MPRRTPWARRPIHAVAPLLAALCLALAAGPAAAQATGRILGRVLDARSGEPIVGADVRVVGLPFRATTAAEGRFVLAAVPPGERTLRVERLGYRTLELAGVVVRTGRATDVVARVEAQAVQVGGVTVQVERRPPLIDPQSSSSREIVTGRELRELPIDATAQAVELSAGVSEGHFRGGRTGQELYVVDGIEVKNQLEASTQGNGLEFSPGSLEQVEVVTGGFGAEYGSALSGVVNLVTRRGNPERWDGRAALATDGWAPTPLFLGFTSLSASAGGPLSFLGSGTTLFADLLLQGMRDADPRARGLTCLGRGDAGSDLDDAIGQLRGDARTASLYCPYTSAMLPNQAGDKAIGFLRLDRTLGPGAILTATFLRNRQQQELYTPEFKYNPDYQFGERTRGALATLALEWSRSAGATARHVSLRAAATQVDRHLGALDARALADRTDVLGFGPSAFRFLGEEYVHRPVEEQLEEGIAVPGYVAPTGGTSNPFGAAGDGIFFTHGTPGLAAWSRSRSVGADALAEVATARGGRVRLGGTGRLYEVERYERILGYLPGSSPNYARFYPATFALFAEGGKDTPGEVNFNAGVRFEGFRSGLAFRPDRGDFLSPVVDTRWNLAFMPRIGAAFPLAERTVVRVNYGIVAQPPDFQYFLDSAIGDSLRTDIRRQGNPALGFERGVTYEIGLSHLLKGDRAALGVVVYHKTLNNLVAAGVGRAGPAQFNTRDHGEVQGGEVTLEGRWHAVLLRAGYALQKATGVSAGALADTLPTGGAGEAPPQEYPLPFDRRHSANLAAFLGSANRTDQPWGAVVTGTLESGYPVVRIETEAANPRRTRLPWTADFDVRLTYRVGRLPACGRCAWRVQADARNVLGLGNIRAVRTETGTLAPTLASLRQLAAAKTIDRPIPLESPTYAAAVDLDHDGLITPDEFSTARLAAVIDRYDPSLYFGRARQLRLGAEVTF